MDETPQSDELVLDGLDDITIELKTESENGGGDEEQVEPEGEEKVEEQEEEEKQEQEEQKKEQDNNNDDDDDDEGSSPSPKKEKGGLSSLILNTPTNPTDDFDQQAAEWDAVEAVQQQQLTYEQEQDAAGVKGKIKSADIRAPGHLLTYLDASRYFFEELNPLKDQRDNIVRTSDVDYEGCDSFLNLFSCCCCCECCALYTEELTTLGEEQRDNILALALTPFDDEDPVHTRVLITVYRRLTELPRDCARFGSHWQDIGFQDSNPSTDLRSAGMFGLLQLISFFKYDPKLALKTYQLSCDEKQEFPFAVVSLNITRIVMQAMREGRLNVLANKSNADPKNTMYDEGMYQIASHFYVGCYYRMFNDWKKNKYTIRDFGTYLKELTAMAKADPEWMINEWKSAKIESVELDDLELVEL
eukprot:TRINITY_DN1607_c0_g2_i3.p1 TRINITY_DN1607_c0_g2~~TRINITY_DN1607_c0_g2_i3.p1  ORF type:complete len:416 (-),score=127.53 TRINITY_DN1607_c0_g2_i3:42-1289(-)